MAKSQTATAEKTDVDTDTGEILEESVAASKIIEAFAAGGTTIEPGDNPEAIQKRIVDRIFKADTLDDLFGQWEMLASDQLEGRTFTITACDFDVYTPNDGGAQVPLAKVTATEKDETVRFITTAPNLTAFIARAAMINEIPFTAKIVGERTKRGFTALHFARPA